MRKLSAFLILAGVLSLHAQTTTISYTGTSTAFANPERGFYKHTETHSASYAPLSQSVLNGYRQNENITLILRVFYLEDFIASPISSTYLSNMQQDFAKVRNAGLKCIVRFAYSDDNDNGLPQDATKSQVLAHISQLTPILQSNIDVIPVAQAGFVGAWGEWYYTTNFGMNPTPTDYQNRKDVVNALLAALPNRMVQIRTPKLKMNTMNSTAAIASSQAFTNSALARVGHHNDCFLASSSDYGTYSNTSVEYPYLEQETKYLPMGGETCAVNAPRSQCQTALAEMSKFHWSYLNLDYHPGVIDGFESLDCFDEIENRLGYRFELKSGIFPTNATAGGVLPIVLQVKNNGFAAPYNQRTAYIVLKNTVTDQEYSIPMASDPRLWLGGTQQAINETLTVPANVVAGSYKMFIHMPDSNTDLATRPEYSIRFANNNSWLASKGYNDLQHTINIGTSLAVGDYETSSNDFVVYPVPTNNELTMQFDGIDEFNVTVHNTLGQLIKLPVRNEGANKSILNTQSLSNGIYFVSIERGNQKETKKIIVRH